MLFQDLNRMLREISYGLFLSFLCHFSCFFPFSWGGPRCQGLLAEEEASLEKEKGNLQAEIQAVEELLKEVGDATGEKAV